MNEQKLLIKLALLDDNEKQDLYDILTEKHMWIDRPRHSLSKLIGLGFVEVHKSTDEFVARELDSAGNTRETKYYQYLYLPTELAEEILE